MCAKRTALMCAKHGGAERCAARRPLQGTEQTTHLSPLLKRTGQGAG